MGTAATDNPLSPTQAAKTLMVLGLLKSGPRHGYELHQIVVAHGSLYADFKKPTLYHLLHRLTVQDAVRVRSEAGTRGRRGERLVFSLTAGGERLFRRLLRTALSSCDTGQASFESSIAFLQWLPARDAQALLKKRCVVLRARRGELVAELQFLDRQPRSPRIASLSLAVDHALCLMDAEIAWMDRTIGQLPSRGPRQAAARRACLDPAERADASGYASRA